MRVLWLPAVLRAAGLTVHEVSGWKSRGADSFGPVRGITCHHTAGSRGSSDEGEINTLVNGRPGLSGPISQLYLSRTGAWHVIASGHCNHNLVGWAGPNEGYGNDALLGIEAQHSGGDEPWTARQYNSYVRGVAALVRHRASGWDVTVDRVAGHREHQPGAKTDPSFSMSNFRARVRTEIDDWDDDVTPEDLTKIAALITASENRIKADLSARVDDFLSVKTGSEAYAARTVRNFINDLHGLRDYLKGDADGVEFSGVTAASPVRQAIEATARIEEKLDALTTLPEVTREDVLAAIQEAFRGIMKAGAQ